MTLTHIRFEDGTIGESNQELPVGLSSFIACYAIDALQVGAVIEVLKHREPVEMVGNFVYMRYLSSLV